MPYLSLYRKYRPQQFEQVMGQEHVVQTLQNALRLGHVANGYLFCGTRGVAKTTIARILAKCLNCIGPDGALTTPQSEPCNQCEPCRSIQAGQNIDVVEMDAASNRSVSDIAKLRESVQFGPMESRYKVYIVDEAHQLSSDAKDAFLKTLEEPPANVVFILATTEAHAIPITIASRCQQFDFRRGSVRQIAEQCARVLAREQPGAAMPDDALTLVAQAAEGSYRDALSLLDQVLAYKRENITAADVAAALGTVESKTLDTVLAAVASQDAPTLFAEADEIYLRGKDVRQFLRALGSRLRDLLLISTGAGASGADKAAADDARQLASRFSTGALVRLMEIVTEAERQTRTSDQHRLLMELTLLKLATAASQSPSPVASAATRVAPAAEPRDTAIARNGHPEAKPAEPRLAPVSDGTPSVPAKAPPIRQPEPAPEVREPVPIVRTVEPPVVKTINEISIPPSLDAPVSSEPRASAAPIAPASGDTDAVLLRLQNAWQEVIHHMQVRFPAGAAIVKDAVPVALEGTVVHLEFAIKGIKLENPKRREAVEMIINKVLRVADGTYKVRAVDAAAPSISNGAAARNSVAAEPAPAPVSERQYETAELTENDDSTPILDEVISVFGGRIIDEDSY